MACFYSLQDVLLQYRSFNLFFDLYYFLGEFGIFWTYFTLFQDFSKFGMFTIFTSSPLFTLHILVLRSPFTAHIVVSSPLVLSW